MTYTPKPWSYEVHELSEGFSAIVYDGNGVKIADHLTEEVAERIVRACNAHDDLVAALESAQKLQQWAAKLITEAHAQSHDDITQLSKTEAWQELDWSMRDGVMASYRDEFAEALTKAKGGAA